MPSNNTTVLPPVGCKRSWLVLDVKSPSIAISFGALIGITSIFEIISTFLNISVLVGILRLWRSNSHRNTAVLINLVVTDLIYNFTAELLYTVHLILQLHDILNCRIVVAIGVFGLFLCIISFSMLVLATVERYIAIFYPFKYVQYSHSKASFVAIAVVYLLAAVFTAMFRLSNFSFAAGISVLVLFASGGVFLVIAFIRMLCLGQKIRRQLENQLVGRIDPKNASSSSSSPRNNLTVNAIRANNQVSPIAPRTANANDRAENRRNMRAWRRNRRNAYLIAALLACLLACYLPYLVGVSLFVFAKSSVTVTKEMLHWLWFFMLINASLNPVFFFFGDKEIRFHIKKALGLNRSVEFESTITKISRSSSIVTSAVSPLPPARMVKPL